jgi:hypothetical protein
VAGRARRLAFLLRRRRSPKENMPRPTSSKHERQRNSVNDCFLDATFVGLEAIAEDQKWSMCPRGPKKKPRPRPGLKSKEIQPPEAIGRLDDSEPTPESEPRPVPIWGATK